MLFYLLYLILYLESPKHRLFQKRLNLGFDTNLSRPDSRSDPVGRSEPVSGCETIYMGLFTCFFFRGSNFMFDTISLCSFKAKVLRVLFQLESPNLEYQNSSYVQNNPDYSMIKTETEFDLYMAPLGVNF